MSAVPAVLDPDLLERIILGSVALLGLVSFVVLRSVQKTSTKLVLLIVIVGLAGGLFYSRQELSKCGRTCRCSLFGQDVEVPNLPFGCR